jgi:FkbM family methyltransferase
VFSSNSALALAVYRLEAALLRVWPFARGRWWLRSRFAGHLRVKTSTGHWIRVSGVADYEWQLAETRAHKEDSTLHTLQRLVSPGDAVLDLGANIGIFTLAAASLVGPAGCVHACEPGSRARQRLNENIAINRLRNAHVYNFAIGDHDHVARLYIGGDSEGSSLVHADDPNAPVEEVPVRSIDSWLHEASMASVRDRISVVKLDVEGNEVAAIRGGHALFTGRRRPSIIVEANPLTLSHAGESIQTLRESLQQYGYRVEVLERMPWSGVVVENWLAVPSDGRS